MKKKIIAIILVITIAAGAYLAYNSNNTDSSLKSQKPADGYDILKGTWYVGAIYYKNKLIDISDNDALSDLYDTTFLAFREDGTFTFSDLFMRDGTYTRKESINGKETFILRTDRVYTYSFIDGRMVEEDKEDGVKKSYLLTIKNSNTFEFVEMDAMTGQAKTGEMPLIFELSNQESDYIASNKTEIKDTTTKKAESTTRKPTTTKATEPTYSSSSTAGQRNALRSAKLYLSSMPFSHDGLIKQLEYEGYSSTDAKFAADNCGADWYAQAVKCAENYLKTMPFSRDDLIYQLEYEGYTHDQAVYGVNKAYN